MNRYLLLITLITTLPFSVLSETCPDLPERKKSFFIFDQPIDKKLLSAQITQLGKVQVYQDCKDSDSTYVLVQKLKQEKEALEKQKTEKELSIKQLKDKGGDTTALEAELKLVDEKLTPKTQEYIKYKDKLNTWEVGTSVICELKSKAEVPLAENDKDCLNLLITKLTSEKELYPIKIELDENSTDAQKADAKKTEERNKEINGFIDYELTVIKQTLPATKLEQSPSKELMLSAIKNSGVISNNTKVAIDILNSRSAEIALFRQKLKVLQRNTNILIEKMGDIKNCAAVEYHDEHTPFLFDFSIYVRAQTQEEIKKEQEKEKEAQEQQNRYLELTRAEKQICHQYTELEELIEQTLVHSYDDSWFQNKNLEKEILDIESLMNELDGLTSLNTPSEQLKATPAKRLNFLQHSSAFFEKYNKSGRFNIGMGVSMFKAPGTIYTKRVPYDIQPFMQTSVPKQDIELKSEMPDVQELSPYVLIKTSLIDIGITFPGYRETFETVDGIKRWAEVGAQEPSFLTQTTTQWNYEVDFDVKADLKLISALKTCNFNIWLCTDVKRYFRNRAPNLDVGITFIAVTDFQLTQTFTTDIRAQGDDALSFNQLANSYITTSTQTTNTSLRYHGISFVYYMADQLRLEGSWKRYQSSSRDELSLQRKSSWGMNFTYLFF